MAKALVLDGQLRSALAVTRSLGRKGIEAHVVGDTWATTSFFSKHCRRRIILPSIQTDSPGFTRQFFQLLERERYSVIYPITNDSLDFLDSHRERINPLAGLLLPSAASLRIARDKALVGRLAEELNIPVPRRFELKAGENPADAARRFEYPILVKPRIGYGSRGVGVARSAHEFTSVYQAAAKIHPDPLIQEFIPPGGAAIGASVFFDAAARPKSVFVHKRIREYPVSGGPSTLRISIKHPQAGEYALRLCGHLGWRGVAMVEFKEDPRTGELKLLEVNPRFWGSLALAVNSGVDFPYLYYLAAAGKRVPVPSEYVEGMMCRWLLPGDLLNFVYNPNRFTLEPSFFRFFGKNLRYDIISITDPLPALGRISAFIRYLADRDIWTFVLRR
jgi:predicted ATP-grasp superfamily ATP-dependent carboligase